MTLSRKSIDTLIDLVENKLGCMEVYDRDDSRELSRLQKCRHELVQLRTGVVPGRVIPLTADGVAN